MFFPEAVFFFYLFFQAWEILTNSKFTALDEVHVWYGCVSFYWFLMSIRIRSWIVEACCKVQLDLQDNLDKDKTLFLILKLCLCEYTFQKYFKKFHYLKKKL